MSLDFQATIYENKILLGDKVYCIKIIATDTCNFFIYPKIEISIYKKDQLEFTYLFKCERPITTDNLKDIAAVFLTAAQKLSNANIELDYIMGC